MAASSSRLSADVQHSCFLCITSLQHGARHVMSRGRIQLVLRRLETTPVSVASPHESPAGGYVSITASLPASLRLHSRLKTHLQRCYPSSKQHDHRQFCRKAITDLVACSLTLLCTDLCLSSGQCDFIPRENALYQHIIFFCFSTTSIQIIEAKLSYYSKIWT